jgi:hypothetical protein
MAIFIFVCDNGMNHRDNTIFADAPNLASENTTSGTALSFQTNRIGNANQKVTTIFYSTGYTRIFEKSNPVRFAESMFCDPFLP